MYFVCEPCEYETNDISNFTRHKRSIKHKRITREIEKDSHSSCDSEQDQNFEQTIINMQKNDNYEKKYQESKTTNCLNNYNEQNTELKNKIIFLEEQNKDFKSRIISLEEQNKKLLDTVLKFVDNGNNQVIVKSTVKKQQIPKALKNLVWDTHVGKHIGETLCKCCNKTPITQMNFQCGHIIAEVNGGSMTVENLLPICQPCNNSMYTKNLLDFSEQLMNAQKST